MFSCEFSKKIQDRFFTEGLWTAASEKYRFYEKLEERMTGSKKTN